jgi:hypothetical protein
VDLVQIEDGTTVLVEAKSAQTIAGDFLHNLHAAEPLLYGQKSSMKIEKRLVYGGAEASRRRDVDIVPWLDV